MSRTKSTTVYLHVFSLHCNVNSTVGRQHTMVGTFFIHQPLAFFRVRTCVQVATPMKTAVYFSTKILDATFAVNASLFDVNKKYIS